MRLAASHGHGNAVNRLSNRSLCATIAGQIRTINTKPKHERPQPITEQINLRPQPNPRAQSIGILGGGITGLASAWHLSRFMPEAKITIYEKRDRLGGWLESEIVDADGGEVLFEWGPRSLRPDPAGSGRATILLLLQLGLQESVVGVSKSSPAALNRFIYYGNRLVKMPGPNPQLPLFWNAVRNGFKVLTEPIFKGIASNILAEYRIQPRPTNLADQSVGDFISRRFGKVAADNIASAFFHGIYAGDLYNLSARTLLPALWHMETRDPEGSGILMEMADIAFKGQGLMQFKHGRYVDLLEAAADHDGRGTAALMEAMYHDMSVYTFTHGLQQLTDRLTERLEANPNVKVKKTSTVKQLKFKQDSRRIEVNVDGNEKSGEHDYVVSTLSGPMVHEFISHSATSRGTKARTDIKKTSDDSGNSVNVGVVNLYYSNPDLIASEYRGFGYLIPRSVELDQNPERGLGVIFGSETSGLRGKLAVQHMPNPAKARLKFDETFLEEMNKGSPPLLNEEGRQNHAKMLAELETRKKELAGEPDEITVRTGQDTAPGTKLTVMLGGHWWKDWSDADLPNEAQLIDMAQTLLARHLKIMEAPLVAKARINRDCIPQYHVGYRNQMAGVHQGLVEEFRGRLKVAGPWWQGGVGVNDCVMSAHMTAFNIREEWDDETGLKEYTEKEKWLICDRRTQTFALDTAR